MNRNFRGRATKIAWGFFWLLLAGLILANYFGGFLTLGVWSIIFAAIALIILFHCFATLSFAALPIPLGALYYILQYPLEEPLGLPIINFWPLAAVAILLTCGLHFLLPNRFGSGKYVHFGVSDNRSKRRNNKGYNRVRYDGRGNVKTHFNKEFSKEMKEEIKEELEDVIDELNDAMDEVHSVMDEVNEAVNDIDDTIDVEYDEARIEENDDANNPYINVSFGYASRFLHADRLESAELSCSFGGMEVYFDHVNLAPEGAEINVNCNFGSIEIFVPTNWYVIDEVRASLANCEVSRRLQANGPNAPTVRLTGSVSLGNVEVSRIK